MLFDLSRYLALVPAERAVVDILVLADDPLSATLLGKCLARYGREWRAVSAADVKALCGALERARFVETRTERKNDVFAAAEGVKSPILCHLIRDGRLLEVEARLAAALPLPSKSSWAPLPQGIVQRALLTGQDSLVWEQIDLAGISPVLPLASRLDGVDLLDGLTEAGRSIVLRAWLLLFFRGEGTALPLTARILTELSLKIGANAALKERLMTWTAMAALLSGDVEALHSLCGKVPSSPFLEPAVAYLKGEKNGAVFREVLLRWRKEEGKRQGFPCDLFFLFYLLSLVEADGPAENRELLGLCRWALRGKGRFPLLLSPRAFQHVAERRLGEVPERNWKTILDAFVEADSILTPLDEVIARLLFALVAPSEGRDFLTAEWQIERGNPVGDRHSYALVASERALLQARMEERQPPREVTAFFEERGLVSVCDRLLPRQNWEGKLETLLAMARRSPSEAKAETERRLVWLMDFPAEGHSLFVLDALEQKRLKSGSWSKGKRAAIERLLSTADLYPPEDRAVLASFRQEVENYWGHKEIAVTCDETRAVPALVVHGRVAFADEPDAFLSFEERPASLALSRKRAGWLLRLSPSLDLEEAGKKYVFWQEEEPHRLLFASVDDSVRALASFLGKKGLAIPAEGEGRLFETLQALAPLVDVDPALSLLAAKAELVETESLPRLRFQPRGEGVNVRVGCRPLGDEGTFLPAGQGKADVVGSLRGRPVRARRDLGAEKASLDALVEACPLLAEGEGPFLEQDLPDLESTLELLLSLRESPVPFRPEWPEGKPLSVGGRADADRLSLRVRRRDDWLAVEGEIVLDEGRVVALRTLLAAVEGTKRFISIGDGAFLALSSRLKKRLESLAAMARKKGEEQALPLLAAPFLAETALEASVEGDSGWNDLKERLREAAQKPAALPRAFRGKLRDYQEEGFRWMASLAHWGGGACLADDMGLGKTIQALALLAHRQGLGAALVVAPTSVCSNWQAEAERFTPSLKTHLFASADRKALVGEAASGDVVLCSWALLQIERELFTSRSWSTVVLDEAQAMKNPQTRRAQAAVALKADFRVALSGTPVENSLVELWSLFRFLNPGLLGSLEAFRRRFVVPVEERGDRDARSRLRRLVRPFILRRTKEEVLEELPSITEVTLDVELSDEERAFYEALRRDALEKIAAGGPEGGRFRILAELMRLRRAACHPRLVADVPLESSSKMDLLLQSLEEIRQGGHRALVFSQFVDHLALVRRALDEAAISYQYLDGSTPQKERGLIVEAFQRGEGDCFLISLRAGGLGLNLTGADYVIHLDPWWNPAVEDQATDRAHRIGQERPVTVLRLLAKGTVEEKIVALHRDKRELAQALLDGTDRAVTLTEEELLSLLKG